MSRKQRVLVIDDEKAIRRLLRILLTEHGYDCVEAENGQHGLAEAATRHPDAILLDLGLPDLEGHEVLKRLREWTSVPVLILSVRDGPEDKIKGLDEGADDYVTKPFDSAELLARLRAVLRRSAESTEEPIRILGPLTIDFSDHRVYWDGQPMEFTPTEYALLAVLLRSAGRVITHQQLLREVWGPHAEGRADYLRVYMTHLRKKIEGKEAGLFIRTEPGIGYRFVR